MGNTFAAERSFCVRLLSSSSDILNNPITANKLVPVADVKWGSQARALGCFFRMCIVVGQVITIMDHIVLHNSVGIVNPSGIQLYLFSFNNTDDISIHYMNMWSCLKMLLRFVFFFLFFEGCVTLR